jgi:flagellar hook assembly protein FlgD
LKIPLEFPDSILSLNIENVKTGQKAGLLAAQVISELKPNESKTFDWDQRDTNANQAEPGIYKVSMTKNLHNTQPVTANTTFNISRNQ